MRVKYWIARDFLTAARLHVYAAGRRAGLAGGHASDAIDMTSRQPLISPSARNEVSKATTLRAAVERGSDGGQNGGAQCNILRRLGPIWVNSSL